MSRTKGRQPWVADTNVLVVANRRSNESLVCVNACSQALLRIKKWGSLLLDEQGLILQEYRRHLSFSGQPGVGDSFFKWVHDNSGRQDLIQRVRITPRDDDPSNFLEFPDYPELGTFDVSDRKFVAVARASRANPAILNGTDRDWWDYRDALKGAGVKVRFLCPEQFSDRETW